MTQTVTSELQQCRIFNAAVITLLRHLFTDLFRYANEGRTGHRTDGTTHADIPITVDQARSGSDISAWPDEFFFYSKGPFGLLQFIALRYPVKECKLKPIP